MPRLSAKTKKIRDTRFLQAVIETGSIKQAAYKTGKITTEHSAESTGSQKMRNLESSMLDALLEAGVTPRLLATNIKTLVEHENPKAKNDGITQAGKFGVGGGYAAEKSINLNVNTNPEDMTKFDKIREEYEEKLLKQIGGGND